MDYLSGGRAIKNTFSSRLRRAMTSGEPGEFGARRGLQIGDRGYGQNFHWRQFRRAGVAKIGAARGSDRRGEPRLGAQLIAAGEKDELIRPGAQFIADVADQIDEIAVRSDKRRRAFVRPPLTSCVWRGLPDRSLTSTISRERRNRRRLPCSSVWSKLAPAASGLVRQAVAATLWTCTSWPPLCSMASMAARSSSSVRVRAQSSSPPRANCACAQLR